MTKQDPWFFQQRAAAFASLMLTAHDQVAVRAQAGSDMAIDLLVEVLKAGKSTLRFFGIQLIPFMDLPTIEAANERVRSRMPRGQLEAELPICAFVIGVRQPEGIYRWVVEPVVENGQALLRGVEEANWQTLDEAGAARLIDQVSAWYDARNGNSTAKPRGRRAKTES